MKTAFCGFCNAQTTYLKKDNRCTECGRPIFELVCSDHLENQAAIRRDQIMRRNKWRKFDPKFDQATYETVIRFRNDECKIVQYSELETGDLYDLIRIPKKPHHFVIETLLG